MVPPEDAHRAQLLYGFTTEAIQPHGHTTIINLHTGSLVGVAKRNASDTRQAEMCGTSV